MKFKLTAKINYKILKNNKLLPFVIANGSNLTLYRILGLKPSGAFCGEFGFVILVFEAAE